MADRLPDSMPEGMPEHIEWQTNVTLDAILEFG